MSKLSVEDKYYTSAELVERHIQHVESIKPLGEFSSIIEPSAGNGAFLSPLKDYNVFSFDISPEHNSIQKADWLKDDLSGCIDKNSLIIGNPPFGKNSSLAVRFFNKAAEYNPKIIAFILPRTFSKPRFWSKLSVKYSLKSEFVCSKRSFLLNGIPWDVPCVSQVWEAEDRQDKLPNNLTLFEEVPEENSRCFIRRVGGKAGQVVDSYTRSTTYSVNCSEDTYSALCENKDSLSKFSQNTAGVRSITLLEIEDILMGRC